MIEKGFSEETSFSFSVRKSNSESKYQETNPLYWSKRFIFSFIMMEIPYNVLIHDSDGTSKIKGGRICPNYVKMLLEILHLKNVH